MRRWHSLPGLVLLGVIALVGCGDASGADAAVVDGGARDTGGARSDGGAGEADAGAELDATTEGDMDGGEDAATDAPSIDGGVPPTDAHCGRAVAPETCNRYDDDCDGRVDEGACRGCRAISGPGDRLYLLCTELMSEIEGARYWMGRCATLGEGYGPVIFEDPGEQLFVGAQLGTAEGWIGLERFGGSPAPYQWADGRVVTAAELAFAVDDPPVPGDTCFTLRDNDIHGELCAAMSPLQHGYICEGALRVAPPEPAPETCDGVDEDLDGRTDEGQCDGCDFFAFGDHRYYECANDSPTGTTLRTWDGSRARCQALSAGGRELDLATIDSRDENRAIYLARQSDRLWIGASNDPGRLPEAAGPRWVWVDGRLVSEGFHAWRLDQGNEPELECAAIHSGLEFWESKNCLAENVSPICETRPLAGP